MNNFKAFSLTFYLNNEKYIIKIIQPITINEIVTFFNYNKNLIVIECNNKIYNIENWNKKIVKNNDNINIITIVGGG